MIDQQQTLEMITVDDRIIDMDQLGHAIVAAEGDLGLAAERLLGSRHKEAQLLQAISANPAALQAFSDKARALSIMKSISLMSAFHLNALEGAHTLSAEKAAAMFIKMADVMDRLSRQVSTPVASSDPLRDSMRQLPSKIEDALKAVMQNPEYLQPIRGEINAPRAIQVVDEETPGALYRRSV